MKVFKVTFFQAAFLFTFGFVIGMNLFNSVYKSELNQIRSAISECEKTLARDKNCKLIINAEVDNLK